MTTEVLITGRTHMQGNIRCIGGLDLIHPRSYRFLNPDGSNYDIVRDPEFRIAPFEVGKVFRIEYAPAPKITTPHTEDVLVYHAKDLRDEADVRGVIERLGVRLYSGVGVRGLFDGKLVFKGNKAYVSPENPSDHSTCFWVSNVPIKPFKEIDKQTNKERYRMLCDGLNLPYVGEGEIRELAPGTLVRFSLSREFKPGDGSPGGCFLQLSGWF